VRLVSLELRNYRNYARLNLEPAAGLNVLLGPNGQGKTNLLESVALLALSSSPRARRESDLVGPLGPEARVIALVECQGRPAEIRISVRTEESATRRRIEVDGLPRRAVDLPGLFRATLFWPDDLNLVKAGPEHRRRLLNQLLVQVRPGYARALAHYGRALEQRNSLLKRVANGEQPVDALDVWDLQLARTGVELVAGRREVVEVLAQEAARLHGRISGGETLEVAYEGPPDELLQALRQTRADDVRRGATGVGPHRDDLMVQLDGADARSFASQGQQRTIVISLKLAEAAVVTTLTGERPVLLLDDVLSELDSSRRSALLEHLAGPGQVIVTSVEADPFPVGVIGRSRVWQVRQGRLVPCG
jgi:DNA replication and repair protein RecF